MKRCQQLTLNLHLHDEPTLRNFVGGDNHCLVVELQNLLWHPNFELYCLWGERGVGKTHLLTALCREFSEHQLTASLISLKDPVIDPSILENLERLHLLCIDDVQLIVGNATWEEQLFHCFNRLQTAGRKLVITANAPPQQLAWQLADLKSRLGGGLIFAVQRLSDEDKIAWLKLRAHQRGLVLEDGVARFILNHYDRNIPQLVKMLNKLDQASLMEQRKLTIPFVKAILEEVLPLDRKELAGDGVAIKG